MYRMLLSLLLVLSGFMGFAQQGASLQGRLVNGTTKEALANITVVLEKNKQSTVTNAQGEFTLRNLSAGSDRLTFQAAQIPTTTVSVVINKSGVTTLPPQEIVPNKILENDLININMISEEMLDEDVESSTQNISSMVILSNDVYLKRVGFGLSPFRFRIRGYDNNYEQKYINGVLANDQYRGVFNYASIGALNDLTRNGDAVNYLDRSNFGFGSIGGAENINMRASAFAKGSKVTMSYTNRNYYSRGMASYATGLQDNGFALVAAIGGRYADKGYVQGTFYENFSYALSLEKQWDKGRHSLSFTTFGSPVKRGQQGASFQEAYDLLGNNLYNPNWGYQDGKVRNSRVVKAFDPTAIISHIWKIDPQTTLTSGASFHYGQYGNSSLNWYNGFDPRPDYYRYLPSYNTGNTDVFNQYTNLWKSNNTDYTQINWDKLYEVNKLEGRVNDGAAIYMVEQRQSNLLEGSVSSVLNKQMNQNLKLTAGIGARSTTSRQFKTVDDLLGASYVLDIDKFAERDFPGNSSVVENDLTNPGNKARLGDKFGYNFDINIKSANLWVQNEYSFRSIDFFYGTQLSYTGFYRDGKMKNGRYPDNSYGKGETHDFVNFGFKSGATYKFSGRQFLTGKISYQTEAPLSTNAYISPRIMDRAVKNMESSKVLSADINYIVSLPRLSARVSAFQTNFYDQLDRSSYYHDAERTFINHALSGVNKVNRGVELGASYKVTDALTLDFVGSLAEYYYSNNPMGVINSENGLINNREETVYLKDYYVGSVPQSVASLGARYFYDFWFFGANLNYAGRNYIDIAPLRRLASNYVSVSPADPAMFESYQKLTNQEKFADAYTVDLSLGKIFYLKNGKSINFNFSVNNVLNKKNIRTGGYEQGRLDLASPDKFASKYFYMQGTNVFLNANYKF